MSIRTSKKTVTFRKPFVLGGFDEVMPAGAYSVETDEELLQGISFPAYRRILTVIRLHSKSDNPGLTRTLTIDPNELDAALKRDQAPAQHVASQEILKATVDSCGEETDDQAIERGEDEGMIVHAKRTPARQVLRNGVSSPSPKPLPLTEAEVQLRKSPRAEAVAVK